MSLYMKASIITFYTADIHHLSLKQCLCFIQLSHKALTLIIGSTSKLKGPIIIAIILPAPADMLGHVPGRNPEQERYLSTESSTLKDSLLLFLYISCYYTLQSLYAKPDLARS